MTTFEPVKFLLITFGYSMLGWLLAIFNGVARGAPGFGLWVWLWPLYLPGVLVAKVYLQLRSNFSDWCDRQLYNLIGQDNEEIQETDDSEPARTHKATPETRDPQAAAFPKARRAPRDA